MKILNIVQRLFINDQTVESVMKMNSVIRPPNFGISVVGNLILGAKKLLLSCGAPGARECAEVTSLACQSSEILSILALSS